MALQLPIYLDNHATTRTDPRVVEAMAPLFLEDYGNAASAGHAFGWRAAEALERARETLAAALAAAPREIVFTSGGTESNNLALLGAAGRRPTGRDHLVTVASEHRSVLDPCRALARRGCTLSVLPVDSQGLVDPDDVRRALTDRTFLVSVMAANNEIGVLQPLAEIGAVCRERGVLFHSDAVQAFGKLPLDVERVGADLVSLAAHKLYGPKGVGALYVRSRGPRVRLEPRIRGGGQERGLRSGTVAVPLVAGFARAVELCLEEQASEAGRLRALRERLWAALRNALDGVALNGHPTRRLPGSLNLCFAGIDADELLLALPEVALSSGSACAGREPSHVLAALGLPAARVRGSLRFGIGRFNSAEEIDVVAEALIAGVQRLRGSRPRKGRTASLPSPASRRSGQARTAQARKEPQT